jgi:cytosine/uracil/thiamine/allantoin permease
VIATLVGVGVVVTGFLVPSLSFLARGAWFTGAIASGLIYAVLAERPPKGDPA